MTAYSFGSRSVSIACAAGLALALSACATTQKVRPAQLTNAQDSPKISDAVTQPFTDLGLRKDKPHPLLAKAASDPYAAAPSSCSALTAEIASLDQVLGRDVDQAAPKSTTGDQVNNLVADAARSATNIPFRGVVRRLTGAEKRTVELRRATLAGTARRAYLKGAYQARGCDNPAPTVAQAAPVAEAAPATTVVAPVIPQ